MAAELDKPEKHIERYCPYEGTPVGDYCASCKKGKVKFEHEFTQPGNPEKGVPDFHSYKCHAGTSFPSYTIEKYNKERKSK